MEKETQKSCIRRALLNGKTITPMYALEHWGCFRLASRISELRNDEGLPIITDIHATEPRYAQYYIAQSDLQRLNS